MSSIKPASRRLPAADGIRGLACLLVLVVHAASLFYPASFNYLHGVGKSAVWLFFLLSAFLLTLQLQRRGFNPANLRDYAIARTLRILPLYIVACLIYYWAGVGIESTAQLTAALTLQQGFIHLWTVAVEFKAYLLLPALCWLAITVQRKFGNFALIMAGLGFVGVQQALWPYWQTPENSPDTHWYVATFVFGVVSALLLPTLRQPSIQRHANAVGVLTLMILVLTIPGVRLWLFATPLANDLSDKHLYFSLLLAIFIGVLIDGHGFVGRLLSSAPIAFVGRISYSTYLIHWLFMVLLAQQWPGQPLAVIAALALSLLAGCLGHYYAEQPLEQLRKYLNARLQVGKPPR